MVRRQLLGFGSRSVDIRLGAHVLDQLSKLAKGVVGKPHRALIVRDATVGDEVAETISRSLADAGFASTVYVPTHTADHVSLTQVEALCDELAACGVTADDMLLGAGDARTCALTAMAAKLWCGGTSCLLIPTTLDAMIRSATELRPFDTAGSRGMITVAPEPNMVVIDVALLADAQPEALCEGYVYMIGAFMADSRRAWDRLGTQLPGIIAGDESALIDAISSTQTSRRLVVTSANPSARHALLYGMTTARALASCLGPEVPWYQLLAEGMRFEARLAVAAASMDVNDVFEQDDRLDDLGIEELAFSLEPTRFIEAIRAEQGRRSNRLLFALPKILGTIRLTVVKDEVLAEHAEAYLASRAELC